MITFLVGGARSGKSTLAVEIGRRHEADGGAVTMIATGVAFDDDMRSRIERHRDERPAWPTIEEPVELADAVAFAPSSSMLIVDCLTVWLGNLYATDTTADDRLERCSAVTAAMRARNAPVVAISNEVGMGIHPETTMGREYRDELGRLNQMVAAAASTTLLLVAGRALRLLPAEDLL